MHYERGISTQIAEHSDVRVEAREVGLGGSVSRQIGEWVRPYSCGRVNVQAHMRRLLKEDRARHHEAAARQEAGSAEREEPYLQTVPAPSAETAGTSHGCASTRARDPIEELGVSRSATPVWCVTRCRAATSHAMGEAPRIPPWRSGRYGSRHGSALTDPT